MAYRLRIVAGPGIGSEVDLGAPEMTIGRAPENGLVINDNNVSRVHAKVQLASNRVVVVDNGSRNGVYVNDRKVSQQPINPGDRVVIGQTVIELVADSPAARPVARPPVARPPAGRAPPQASNGGRGVGTTGALTAPPRGNAARPVPVPAGTGRAAAVARRPAAAVSGARPGAAAGEKKGLPKPVLYGGIGGLIVVFAIIGVISSGGNGKTTGGGSAGTGATPRPTLTPPLFPSQVDTSANTGEEVKRLSKAAQQQIDLGDSARDSGNLVAARKAFQQALKHEPTCLSCSVRLEAVVRDIDRKVGEYTKAGQLAYDAGDFQRSIDMWKIAVEYIGDPKDPRGQTLKRLIENASTQIQRQPQ